MASARSPRDDVRFPAHCLEDACRLVTLESGVLAVVAKGRLTFDSGVLAVGAKGRLAPLFAVTDFNLPRCATFAALRDRGDMPQGADDPRAVWRGVFANGRMGLLQHVCEDCGSANSAESMVRVRAGDTGCDWETNSSQTLPKKPNALANAGHDN